MSIEGTYIKKKFDAVNKNRYDYCIEPYYQKPTCGKSLNYIFREFPCLVS